MTGSGMTRYHVYVITLWEQWDAVLMDRCAIASSMNNDACITEKGPPIRKLNGCIVLYQYHDRAAIGR